MPKTADTQVVLDLVNNPPRLGKLAGAARARRFATNVLIRPVSTTSQSLQSALERDGALVELGSTNERWPKLDGIQDGDKIQLLVLPAHAQAFVAYMVKLVALSFKRVSVAPFTNDAGATHRLWLIGAAALLTEGSDVRVEARHDLIGIRLAQIALAYGADTLAGPLDEDRHLPLAGVTRPTETTQAGLQSLIEQAGLHAVTSPHHNRGTAK